MEGEYHTSSKNEPSEPAKDEGHQATKSSEGNLKAALTYSVGWITGLIFLLIEKEDQFVRFNAAQSIVFFGAINLISFIPILGQLIGLLLWPLSLVMWIVLMVKAYNNEKFELPLINELVAKVEKAVKPQA